MVTTVNLPSDPIVPHTESNTPYSAKKHLESDQATQQCPGCKSINVIEEDQIGAVVCYDCGYVLEETLFNNPVGQNCEGSSRVTSRGRPMYSSFKSKARHPGHQTSAFTEEKKRSSRGKRFEQIRKHLAATGRVSGLTNVDVSRAYYLWRNATSIMSLKFWQHAFRGALACLFLASREHRKGVSLLMIAAQAGVSPFKLGAMYKQIKAVLVERKILDIQAAFAVTADDKEKETSLRSLWSSAQKCMAIATDADLTTGRHPQPLAAACLVIAVEAKLVLTRCPRELIDFAAITFDSTQSTVRLRYNELKKCMLVWANRLPFEKSGQGIKDKKLAYHFEDVIKYFGHLQDGNRRLWALLDRAESMTPDTAGDGDEDIDEDDFHGSSDGHESEQVHGAAWNQDQDLAKPVSESEQEDSVATKVSCQLYPPSYMANVRLLERRHNIVQIAKGEAEYTSPLRRKYKNTEAMDLRRIDIVKRLLDLGIRTEQELLEANDTTLDYWLRSDLAKTSGSNALRSQEELDAVELCSKDLSQQELESYLRTPTETQAVLWVMGSTYKEADERQEMRTRSQNPKRCRDRAARARSQTTADEPARERKKVRSSKINWEAISDEEDEVAEDEVAEDEVAEDEVAEVIVHERESQEPEQVKQDDQEYFGYEDDNYGEGGYDDGDDYDYDYD
ncbi:hypothetical protein BGZ65_003609 [Modicella reniformis]|uniref:Transcription factor IIIB 50 kDa subunit n=1 Tax=Modicella reniformis TaxID=1440133 RepID=A0A9P6IKJ7_9FUNG|nr:hypothetical protein BGZ65_003609 [Modicella reniformis]